ncbi:MAG: zinc-ribbon domain-containing protein, partial [Suilimivivens sp.]
MSEENGLIICPQCGSANPSTFRFCSNCGVKLDKPHTSLTEQQLDDPAPVQQS